MCGSGSTPSSRWIFAASRLLSARGLPIGQSAIVTASTPASRSARTPSIKKPISSSTGGSSSTATTRFPLSSFSQKRLRSAFALSASGARSVTDTRTGGCASSAFLSSAMCSGVVPQQPPRISAPGSAAACCIFSVKYSGVP